MQTILNKFTKEHLFDASAAMLSHLKIKFTPQTKTSIPFEDLYTGATNTPLTMSLTAVLNKVHESFFIGTIDEDSLAGRDSDFDLQQEVEGKYQTMLVFAVEINAGESLTRTELATLTRGFNRMASSLPIIVFIKNDNLLSLATCERSQYRQNWRDGEKLGKVAILRNIDCIKAHRGHIDILESLGDKAYTTFDELYKHWLEVFSSELLTKKFYTELSEWYAWVIASGKVKFPNDINTTEDDAKYNHESVIRLITRLIFVWFLKQKNLVPNEFFDEKYIREHFIANFDPHSTNTLFYNPEQSKYYRLILQNLFFAMLNRPIIDEESGNDENRRFVTAHRYQGKSQDYNINNLLRYKSEFAPGGADLLLEIANSTVPFLNGGLFECLDDKDNGKYYDGFSERKASLEQLSFPDYFFFGDEVGSDVDLSDWYDDSRRNHVKVRGLIDILKRYNFTVEENTPLDQEVSLDPELLGKVFENLLASYNPETNTTARKQTGSFYTPREVVQFMVDESIIAHLSRICGSDKVDIFRNLLSYTTEESDIPVDTKNAIIRALYNCKILDPACGSGAFPMGVLQQMVHALRKLDPSNVIWKEFILDIALARDKEAYLEDDEQERNRKRADIEQSFNRSVNDPDYARKLYLIENCIYGVDIQPIAVQISKLRFFISLIAEQNPTTDVAANFGIRPLPNLEAKFVAANTLLQLKKESNLFASTDELEKTRKELSEANHLIFRARRNQEKKELRKRITELRRLYGQQLLSLGSIGPSAAQLVADWDMFDQNSSASFFDLEWMFGIQNGFDIVIANPPYVSTKGVTPDDKFKYENEFGFSDDLYNLFTFKGLSLCAEGGSMTFITPKTFWTIQSKRNMRDLILSHNLRYIFDTANPFDAVMVDTCIWQVINTSYDREIDNFVQFLDGSSNIINPIVFNPIKQSEYLDTQNSVIFKPTEFNLRISELYGKKVKELYEKWWPKIKTSKDIEKNRAELQAYRDSLRPGDIALLGCLTEGGQGLATANNGKYIAVRRSSKWATNIIRTRPKKLADVISRYKPFIPDYNPTISTNDYLLTLSEKEIADLFDSLKEIYGRDIFGQGYLYKIIDDDEIADVSTLSDDEKENGIDPSKKIYVPYDKGDKDGNRWYLETPFAIAWSKENVRFLRTDPKARYQGYKFYFREGLCWSDINTTFLKCRKKQSSINDVKSMSIYAISDLVTEDYIIVLINSSLFSYYVDTFVNNTQTFQINDARQLPIIIPNDDGLLIAAEIVNRAIEIKKGVRYESLDDLQKYVNDFVELTYNVNQ